MMLPCLTKIGILIDFKINQGFIAEVLCINKEKPITMCNGTCYLSEQLKKAEEQEEKQAPSSKKERLEVVYFLLKSPFDFLSLAIDRTDKSNLTYVDEIYTSSFIMDIFHPPKLILI